MVAQTGGTKGASQSSFERLKLLKLIQKENYSFTVKLIGENQLCKHSELSSVNRAQPPAYSELPCHIQKYLNGKVL